MAVSKRRRMLIWGKTAPELSTKYFETVCTGAVLEDGTPVRIYPIPYRYMDGDQQFKKYQWIEAVIAKSDSDPRLETYRVDGDSIQSGDVIEPDNEEWKARAEILFQKHDWLFDSVEALEQSGKSLGVVVPREIISIELKPRPPEELASFEEKQAAILKALKEDRKQLRVFEEHMPPEYKKLDVVKSRIAVKWRSASGKEHTMQILDWEASEAIRRHGEQKALAAVRSRLSLETHAVRFFLGNFRRYPQSYTIVGLWYPKFAKPRAPKKQPKQDQPGLF